MGEIGFPHEAERSNASVAEPNLSGGSSDTSGRETQNPPNERAESEAGEAGKWAIVDSNHGPPPYQSGALTN